MFLGLGLAFVPRNKARTRMIAYTVFMVLRFLLL